MNLAHRALIEKLNFNKSNKNTRKWAIATSELNKKKTAIKVRNLNKFLLLRQLVIQPIISRKALPEKTGLSS